MNHYYLNMELFQFNNATERWMGDGGIHINKTCTFNGKAIAREAVVAIAAIVLAGAVAAGLIAKGVYNGVVLLIQCISTHRIH